RSSAASARSTSPASSSCSPPRCCRRCSLSGGRCISVPAGFVQDDYVGYGTEAPPVRWPGGAGVAVSLVVNYEEGAERSIGLGDDAGEPIGEWGPYSRPERHPRDRSIESMFQYGSRVGVWRLLDIFRQTEVRTTFFAC